MHHHSPYAPVENYELCSYHNYSLVIGCLVRILQLRRRAAIASSTNTHALRPIINQQATNLHMGRPTGNTIAN